MATSGLEIETSLSLVESNLAGVVSADYGYEGAQLAAGKPRKYIANPKYRTLALEHEAIDASSVQSMM